MSVLLWWDSPRMLVEFCCKSTVMSLLLCHIPERCDHGCKTIYKSHREEHFRIEFEVYRTTYTHVHTCLHICTVTTNIYKQHPEHRHFKWQSKLSLSLDWHLMKELLHSWCAKENRLIKYRQAPVDEITPTSNSVVSHFLSMLAFAFSRAWSCIQCHLARTSCSRQSKWPPIDTRKRAKPFP